VIVIRISSCVVSVYLKPNGRHLRPTTTVKTCTLTTRQITATSQPTISRNSMQMSEMSVKTFTQWLRTMSEKINNYWICHDQQQFFFCIKNLQLVKFLPLSWHFLPLSYFHHPPTFMGDGGGRHWLVRMEWRPARWSVCLPLLIFPCTVKFRSSLLAAAHPGGPGKRAVKRLWWFHEWWRFTWESQSTMHAHWPLS